LCLQIYREIDDLFEDDVNDVVREWTHNWLLCIFLIWYCFMSIWNKDYNFVYKQRNKQNPVKACIDDYCLNEDEWR
jgi:hypothetical protein